MATRKLSQTKKPLEKWGEQFLTVLAATRNQAMACRAVGVSRNVALKARNENPEFAKQWEEIMPLNPALRRAMPSRTHNKAGAPATVWKSRFIEVLGDTQLITEACKAANVSRATAYRMRDEDEQFREQWEEVFNRGLDILEQIAFKRAASGSDNLMMFILKARRRETYGDQIDINQNQTVQGTVTLVDGRNPVEYDSQARRRAAALLMAGEKRQDKSEDEIVDGTAEDIQ